MRRSTVISIALHAAILVWAVAIFPSARLDAPPLLDVPVDVMSPSEFTKLKAGMVDAKDDGPLEKKPDAPKPKALTEKTEPKPEEKVPDKEAEAKPKDEPKTEEKKEVVKAEKPKPVKTEPPKKPKPAPEAKKRDFNADRISALLNKIPDQSQPTPKAADTPPEAKKETHGQSTGTEMTMSVNEIDALRAKIAQCWSPPPGGLGAEHIVVRLRMQLNEDGSLVGYPSVENGGGSGFFQAAADSAVRAVYQCQPYSSLPADKYAVWRDLILNFDPSQMYGSG
ncbi:MAG TPA: cell envelope integrity protein TolA [Methyloceanibacter sp.]